MFQIKRMSDFERIIFLGSPEFAVPSLKALIESERFKPIAVYTQPDRPGGRNLKLKATPVKELALEHGIPVLQPDDINGEDSLAVLAGLGADLLVTVAYGQKLNKAVRNSAVHGAINLHPSLLPELRGAAPIPFALWQGMIQTGISIFRLTGRMDAGPILYSKPLFIFPSENATELAERLAYIGSRCLLQFLNDWSENQQEPIPQDENGATYCRKLEKADYILDWNQPAAEVRNHIRALSLLPGAYTYFRGQQLKVLEADIMEENSGSEPGSVVVLIKNTGFTVQAGTGQLLVKQVQPAGKPAMSAWAYHLGARITPGERMKHNE
jgi:methionyl-tRNA formyltransferase